jgi:hypothetical protein
MRPDIASSSGFFGALTSGGGGGNVTDLLRSSDSKINPRHT